MRSVDRSSGRAIHRAGPRTTNAPPDSSTSTRRAARWLRLTGGPDGARHAGLGIVDITQRVADIVGTPHALALSSGTAALHLALEGLGVGPGDDVITATLTFAATANAITYLGARPVFVEPVNDT